MKLGGIYALYWWDQDLVYIGLSVDLNTRKRVHFKSLQDNKHPNYKVQNAYNLCGKPDFICLEYTSASELSDREVFWVNECEALGPNGLNIADPGSSGAKNKKYTKVKILKVFSLLYKGVQSYVEIERRTSVPRHIVKSIALGKSHIWLAEYYPDKYDKMRLVDRKKIGYNQSSITQTSENAIAVVLDKNNTPHEVFNIKQFAREHGLLSNLFCNVLNGKARSHKGYRLGIKF